MSLEYTIVYQAENKYEHPVKEARWQFLITPFNNQEQELLHFNFENSLGFPYEISSNAYGFTTLRILSRTEFQEISFQASFKLLRKSINPFNFDLPLDLDKEYAAHQELSFRVEHEPFLRKTALTHLDPVYNNLFSYDRSKSVFENLQALNAWVFEKVYYTPGATTVDTTLDVVVETRKGVCQDFAHLFIAIARNYNIPCRYVSGYLHQGNGFFGDSQMHAWTEAYIDGLGWIGFDPTNNLVTNENHIKVAHGKDYTDCAPIKGVLYSKGENTSSHTVKVQGQQQQ